MRQIVLDTETTGLEPSQGHRVIEIGCVEIVNRRVTKRRFQQYLNPERDIDEGAIEVHGITREQLSEKPLFHEVAAEFLEFVTGAELVIHNAPFDVAFLNAELERLGGDWGRIDGYCTVFDTLQLAREMHPGQRNSLDALCRRYEIDNAHRELHGALLDAELLAEVYLAMTGGQTALELDPSSPATLQRDATADATAAHRQHSGFRVVRASPAEMGAHAEFLRRLEAASGGEAVWLQEYRGPGRE
ncbi:MAG: DNA polymerase III subunit epsilon [Gammaproteobacteria bacterium]